MISVSFGGGTKEPLWCLETTCIQKENGRMVTTCCLERGHRGKHLSPANLKTVGGEEYNVPGWTSFLSELIPTE